MCIIMKNIHANDIIVEMLCTHIKILHIINNVIIMNEKANNSLSMLMVVSTLLT